MSSSPNFVYDGSSLPGNKIDATTNPGPSQNYLDASDINAVFGALADIRTQILSYWNLQAYGADPTGNTDIHSAITAACAAIVSAGGGILGLPRGTYSLRTNFSVPSGVTLQFQNSTIAIASGVMLTVEGPILAPNATIFTWTDFTVVPVAWGSQPQPLNASWFGCIGDGTTDNAPFFQAAVLAFYTGVVALSALPGANQAFGGRRPVLTIPQGVYNTASTLEWPGGGILQGLGKVTLQTSANIPILRIAGAFTTIRDIVFVGGQNSIIMYGLCKYLGPLYPGNPVLLNPTSVGNVPCIIEDCNFIYPAGPAIMQDLGPVCEVAATSYGQTINATPGILTVTSNPTTLGFPSSSSGIMEVMTNTGAWLVCSYTGLSGDTFTGVTSTGSGTLGSATGIPVVLNTQNRTFQHALKVQRFFFAGSCLYWGSGDTVYFSEGHVSFYFDNTQTTGDGLPLGLFNSGDTIYVSNVTCFGGAAPLPRSCIFIGCGPINFTNSEFGQNGAIMLRQRIAANSYDNNGLMAAPLSLDQSGGTADNPLWFNCTDCAFVITNLFWAELFETVTKLSLRISGRAAGPDADETFGIWVDSGVNLLSTLGSASAQLIIDNEFPRFGNGSGLGVFDSIYQGFDPGPGANPTAAIGTNITQYFAAFRFSDRAEDMPTASSSAENLFNYLSADSSHFGGIVNSSTGSADTTSGYSLTTYLCGAVAPVAGFILYSADILPSSLLPGVYCFSFYLKTNYQGEIFISIGPYPDGQYQYTRHFDNVTGFQRIETQFYYPGGAASWVFHLIWYPPQSVVAWAGDTNYIASNLVVNGGNIYLCTKAGESAASGGPSGTGSAISDGSGALLWNYVSAGAAFVPTTNIGLWAIHAGRRAAPYTFPQNNDGATQFGWVPRTYYGTAAPTTGTYRIGDQLILTNPEAGGYIGYICTTAGNPGTWNPFGMIGA